MGLGFAGFKHLRAFSNNPRTIISAVCECNEEKLNQVAEEFDVPILTKDFDKLLKAGMDVVVICIPDHLHAEYVLKALECGLNVLCEKPLVTSIEDAGIIVRASKKAGKIFMTGQCARFFERSQLAASLIKSSQLGEIFFAEADYLHDCAEFLKDWRIDPACPQNMVLGGGCHPVDLLRWLVGDVLEVQAFANKKVFPQTNPIKHDCILISLKFLSGAIGKVLVSIGCKRPYSMNIGLYGTKGTMVNEKLFLDYIKGLNDFMHVPVGKHLHEENMVFDLQAQHLVDCLDSGSQPIADALEGAKSVATCLAAVESITTGKIVKVCNKF
jgi:predicted dehydrogenase